MALFVRRFAATIGVLAAALIVVALLAVLVVFVQAARAPAGDGEYVALGSSYAAGPGVGRQAPGSPTLCLRSSSDYPQLVAAALRLNLTDVSCSGATSQHVLDGGQFPLPPQISALRPETRLVTVTIGGNDLAFLGNVFSWTCQNDRAQTPWLWRAGVCRGVATPEQVDQAARELPARLLRIAVEVRRRSPRATLVFVDYLSFLPADETCPERLPLTQAQLERGRDVERRLAEITAAAAHQSGALLVRASELSKGHDICSTDPWAFGLPFPSAMFNWAPMPFHPNAKGMQAIAQAVTKTVEQARP